MGKEIAGPKRRVQVFNPSAFHANKPNFQLELAKQWSSPASRVSIRDVKENASAIVIIRSAFTDTTVILKRLNYKGNSYMRLVKNLKSKGLILKSKKPSAIFIRKGFAWEIVDPAKEAFDAGDRILIFMDTQAKSKKKLRKVTNE